MISTWQTQHSQGSKYHIDSDGQIPDSGHMMAYTSARYDDSPMTGFVLIGRIRVAGPRLFFFAVQFNGSGN